LKKVLPIILAILVFAVAFLFLNARKGKKTEIVVAAYDLPAGHVLTPNDLTLAAIDAATAPDGAYDDPQMLVGQTLRSERTAGDVITGKHLGGQSIELASDERAIAVEVTDSAGLAGLLKAGDLVGLTAVMQMGSNGSYAKMITENLRVLYVSPEFRSLDPAVYQSDPAAEDDGFGASGSGSTRRDPKGVVVLAVPVDSVVVSYDFAPFGVESETRTISVIDLLPALDHISNVDLSLFIQPANAAHFSTSGVSLSDLAITPGPSPTPTPTAIGSIGDGTAMTPAPTPGVTPTP